MIYVYDSQADKLVVDESTVLYDRETGRWLTPMPSALELHLTGELAHSLELTKPFRVDLVGKLGSYAVNCCGATVALMTVEDGVLQLRHSGGERLMPGSGQSVDRFPLADADLLELLQRKVSLLCGKYAANRRKELEVNRSWRHNDNPLYTAAYFGRHGGDPERLP